MKNMLLALGLLISTNALALPGKQEFVINYPEEELRFINDGPVMYLLQSARNPKDRNAKLGSPRCSMALLKNGTAQMGKNKFTFYPDFALVNDKKRYYYTGRKTDLLFYRDLCPKKPRN